MTTTDKARLPDHGRLATKLQRRREMYDAGEAARYATSIGTAAQP